MARLEEAMNSCVSLFPGSEIDDIVPYSPDQAGLEGSIMNATFTVGGETLLCTDSVVKHEFTIFVTCESEDGIRRLSAALSEHGSTLMPLRDYGFSRKFAWVNDRYGVSWQLNLE
jgi:predicted 3-demethylubiquinone-9 3-methyltransferase (glyoxalase superfamily)